MNLIEAGDAGFYRRLGYIAVSAPKPEFLHLHSPDFIDLRKKPPDNNGSDSDYRLSA